MGRRLILAKSPHSKRNATPKKVKLQTGLSSAALRDGLIHRGTKEGRAMLENCLALRAHLGGAPTVVQEKLIADIARLELIQNICWASMMKSGQLVRGAELDPMLQAYFQATKQRMNLLKLIGLERVAKEKGLAEILRGDGAQ